MLLSESRLDVFWSWMCACRNLMMGMIPQWLFICVNPLVLLWFMAESDSRQIFLNGPLMGQAHTNPKAPIATCTSSRCVCSEIRSLLTPTNWSSAKFSSTTAFLQVPSFLIFIFFINLIFVILRIEAENPQLCLYVFFFVFFFLKKQTIA